MVKENFLQCFQIMAAQLVVWGTLSRKRPSLKDPILISSLSDSSESEEFQ